MTSTPDLAPEPHGPSDEHTADASRGFAVQGLRGIAARRLLCCRTAIWSPPAQRSFTPTRSARAPPVTTSSRRRSEDRNRAPSREAEASSMARSRSPPEPATGHEKTVKSQVTASRARGPTVRAARAERPPCPLHRGGGRQRPEPRPEPARAGPRLTRHGRSSRRFRAVGPWDRGPLLPQPREGRWDRLHPRCFPSMDRHGSSSGLSPFARPHAEGCPQFFTSLWKPRSALCSPSLPSSLDGPSGERARPPPPAS